MTSASAITDITGFGLLGHAREMAVQGGVDFRFFLEKLPWLPGAIGYGEARAFPGGMANNMNFFAEHVIFTGDVPIVMQDMLYTPETSGGLLIAIRPEEVDRFCKECEDAIVVGEVIAVEGRIHVAK